MQKVTETGEPGEDFSYLSGWTRAVWVTLVMKTVSAEIMQREWENKKGAERLNWTAKEIQGDLIWLSIALRRWERTGKKATAVAKQRARAKVTDDVVLGLPSRSCSSRSEAVRSILSSQQVRTLLSIAQAEVTVAFVGLTATRSSALTASPSATGFPASDFSWCWELLCMAQMVCLLLSSFVWLDLNLVWLLAKKITHLVSNYLLWIQTAKLWNTEETKTCY